MVKAQELAFYEARGAQFLPTDINVSPWDSRGQNGVALAGLAAHVIDKVVTLTQMHTARLTIDILGLVPRTPLEASVRVVRQGQRVQLVELDLIAGGRAYIRATALRTRIAPSPQSAQPLTRALPEPALARSQLPWVAMHRLEGSFHQPGPGAQWLQILADVVAGHALSQLERVAMTSDFGSSTAPLVSPKEWTFANLDIAAHLTRMPQGEWLLLETISASHGNGVGVIATQLGDVMGMFGHAHQTVFLDARQS
jgi:hypothetical protein